MVDTVTTTVIFDGIRRHVTHITNESDGTGESGVIKVNVSEMANPNAQRLVIEKIDFVVDGFNYVTLYWDHDTDDVAAVLFGVGCIDFRSSGGKVDPGSVGGTGDIILTTDGAADGDSYDITLHLRIKED